MDFFSVFTMIIPFVMFVGLIAFIIWFIVTLKGIGQTLKEIKRLLEEKQSK